MGYFRCFNPSWLRGNATSWEKPDSYTRGSLAAWAWWSNHRTYRWRSVLYIYYNVPSMDFQLCFFAICWCSQHLPAHTEASAKTLSNMIQTIRPEGPLDLVVGMANDKAHFAFAEQLLAGTRTIHPFLTIWNPHASVFVGTQFNGSAEVCVIFWNFLQIQGQMWCCWRKRASLEEPPVPCQLCHWKKYGWLPHATWASVVWTLVPSMVPRLQSTLQTWPHLHRASMENPRWWSGARTTRYCSPAIWSGPPLSSSSRAEAVTIHLQASSVWPAPCIWLHLYCSIWRGTSACWLPGCEGTIGYHTLGAVPVQ